MARSKAAVYRVDVRAGADPLGDRRKSGGGVTVREAMRNWITAKINPKSDRRWSPVTEREYRRILEKDIIPHIGEMPLGELTRQVLMTRVAVVAKRSSSMAAASFRVLGSFVRYCEAMGLTARPDAARRKGRSKPAKA